MSRKRYPDDMYNFETWFEEVKDRVFRIRIYRRIGDWTPYELDHSDEIPSQYIDGETFVYCKIDEAVALPDGDVLLGVRYINKETGQDAGFIEYNKLSNINLVQADVDNEEEVDFYVS